MRERARTHIAVGVLSVAVAGCGGSSAGSGDDQAARRLVDDYVHAAMSRSPERICDLVSDGVLRKATGETGAAGRTACRRNASAVGSGVAGQVRDTRIGSVSVDGDAAAADVALELPQGTIRQTVKLRRQAGGWKVDDVTAAKDQDTGGVAYRVPSESMAPAYKVGQVVFADPKAYAHAKPRYGDVVVFNPPAGAESSECGKPSPRGTVCVVPTKATSDVKFIKRIVGLPGDRIAMRRGRVIRNRRSDTFKIKPCRGGVGECDFPRAITVPAGHYFMVGDNRGASDDSRFWGPVPLKAILGRVGS